MGLNDLTLFNNNNNDKIKKAIDRIREFEPKEGYYLAFSGGKDSIVLKQLTIMAKVKYDIHYNLTTVDPPELVKYIKQVHPDVEIHKPAHSMWQLIVIKRMPPTRLIRYCCERLKEGGGAGRYVLTGIRWAESYKRTKRKMVESCFKDKHRTFVHPIIDWSDREIWLFIKMFKLPYCSLYDEGFKRLGCVLCPMSGKKGMLIDAGRWPKIAESYKRAFSRCLEKRKQDNLTTKWDSAEHMWIWWIYQQKKGDPDQTVLFE